MSKRFFGNRIAPHIIVFVLYALMTGLALDQLLGHFGQALPGDGQHYDYAIFSWDMWWMRHALIELRTSPFTTDFIVHPFTHNLVTHTLVPFWGFLSIPLQSFMGIASILSTFIAISFLLTAYFTFLFAYRQGCSWPLALIAGAWMAFSPPMVHRATEGHLNMLAMWWIPLSLLAFDLTYYSRRFVSALPLALCLYAALLTDFQYMMWVPLVLVPYALVKFFSLAFRSGRNRHYRLAARFGLAFLVFICLTLLYPVPQLLQLDSDYPRALLETAHYYSFSLSALFRGGVADFTIGRMIVPLAIGLGIWGQARKNKLWLSIAFVSLVFALGPYLSLEPLLKTFRLPLPYYLLHKLFDGQYRAPVRFAVPAVFGFSMFIVLEGQALLDRYKTAWTLRLGIAGVMLFLIVLDYGLLCPFPIFYPAKYTVYQEIANDPDDDVVVLEVPLGVDTGYTLFGHGQQLIYYQPIHEKRILNGAISRMPLTAVNDFRSYHLLQAIAGKEEMHTAAASELTQLVEQWNIGYVLIHRDLLTDKESRHILPFFATHPLLCFWRAEGDLLAYHTRLPGGCPPMEGTIQVNMGSPESDAYVGVGLHSPENIGGVMGRWVSGVPTATLRLDLKPQAYCLRFRAWAYPPNQSVTLAVNGVDVAALPMSETWAIYTTTIPAAAIPIGEATAIQFDHATLLSPHEKTGGESTDQRSLGAAYEWVIVEPCSK